VSTLPAIDKAAAPPAIVQILDEGAIGSLGFVHPQTTGLSASSVTTLPEQRQEQAQVHGRQLSEKDAGLVAESWIGLILPSNRAQVLVRRLERMAARLLQGHGSLSSDELPGRGLRHLGGGSEEIRFSPTAQIEGYERGRRLLREVRRVRSVGLRGSVSIRQ
jgi:hypothetical protein